MLKDPYFLGLCEVSSELNKGFDAGLKNEYIGYFAKIFKAKTMRIWLKTNELFVVKENDTLEFKADGLIRLHKYLDILKANGVERFELLDWGFIYPYGYQNSDLFVVPDPIEEASMYARFMKLQAKAKYHIACNFSEIRYFEPTNEPDGRGGAFIHRNGYKGLETPECIYTMDEIEDIVLDLCFNTTVAVRKANPKNMALFPGTCNQPESPGYLDSIYTKIQSGEYPKFGPKSTNIDDYFGKICLHPYNLKDAAINDYWLSTQLAFYDIMCKHGDKDRKVWYNEIGWSDFEREDVKVTNATYFEEFFKVVEEKLPFVETVFPFRLFTLSTRCENEGEDNFGLINNEFDWHYPFLPKPTAIAVYKYANGEDAPLNPLYKYTNKKKFELFETRESNNHDADYKVLVLGNYITLQENASWNKWYVSRGLGSSTVCKDYLHLVLNNLSKKHGDTYFKFVDTKAYEKTFYSLEIIAKVKDFLSNDYDLILVNVGDLFPGCSLVDHDIEVKFKDFAEIFLPFKDKVLFTTSFSQSEEVNKKLMRCISSLGFEYADISHIKENRKCLFLNRMVSDKYRIIPNDIGHSAIAKVINEKLDELGR